MTMTYPYGDEYSDNTGLAGGPKLPLRLARLPIR